MKNIKVKISDEAHKILTNYKLDNNFKTLDQAVEKIIKNANKHKNY